MIGNTIAHYQIEALLGTGGMGEVYKARDTRLNRTVAIKVLSAHFSDNAEMKVRFEREAQTIAGLNHPHICVLYDVGHQDGTHYLVMEYLEGQTLAARLEKGALPLDEALKIAIEIADALDKAHRQGVVHRDLKPSNVMLTKSGAKLLDFGLAKLKQEPQPAPTLSSMPTNADVTAKGTILGTLQYMSPEQLEGQEADARSDIFAFGAMLYEMVTGRKAFEGKSPASLIAAIMHIDPPGVSALQPMTPRILDRTVRRCLAKNPDARWQSAFDLGEELKWVETGSEMTAATAASSVHQRIGVVWKLMATVLILTTVGLSLAVVRLMRPASEPDIVRFVLPAPEKTVFIAGGFGGGGAGAAGSVSPDGRKMAFTAQDATGKILLWIRSLDSLRAQSLPNTDGADSPFWSPDSRWIGFFARGKLKKIDITAGSPQVLCDAPLSRGGTWNRDGLIIFTPNNPGPLSSVSASGGRPVTITKLLPAETNHRLPYFLPDGKHFLYFAAGTGENSVFVGSVGSTESLRLLTADSAALYAPPGYLLFARQGTLLAQRFDPTKLKLQGDALAVADEVASDGNFRSFSVSDTGVLTYRTGAGAQNLQLAWFDRTGKLLDQIGTPGGYLGPSLSPDGQRLAVHRHDAPGGDIWIIEMGRRTTSRFTFDPAQDSSMPIWSPDGKRIVFGSSRNGKWGLYVKQSDGTGNEELLIESDLPKMPMSWTSDGKYIVYWVNDPKTNSDDWVIPLTGDRKPFPILQSPFNEQWPEISPDGKWIAYTSNETGTLEIYVRPFPSGPGKWQISTNGGTFQRWRADGKELYYLSAPNAGKMMAAEIHAAGSSFHADSPRALFDSGYINLFHTTNYHVFAVSADGQRFLIPRPEGSLSADIAATPITVVLNWTAALNKK